MTEKKEISPSMDDQAKKININEFKKIPWYLISGTLIVMSSALSGTHNRGEWCLAIGCMMILAELIMPILNKRR